MFGWPLGQKEKPKVNYIWIGHPPQTKSTEHTVSGQDTKDVLEMARVCKNPIYFYYLDEYRDYYEKIFAGTKVNVQSVDAYIRKIQQEGDEDIRGFAGKIQKIQETVLTPPRGKIVDFVSLKEVFSLFLLATQGGYTVDSNIHPAHGVTSVELPSYSNFRAPYTGSMAGSMIEIWMMYASPTKLDEPRGMLEAYLSGWDKVQAMLDINYENQNKNKEEMISSAIEYPRLYHSSIIDLTVGSVESVYIPSLRTDENWKFDIDVGESHYLAKCKGIPVEKSYGNSHKHDATYAKNQARFDLDRQISFLENQIKKVFREEKSSLFNFSWHNREAQSFEEQILQFIRIEKNQDPEKIIAKLQELGEEAQSLYGTGDRVCGFKKAVDDIIKELKAAFPNRPQPMPK